MPSQPPSRKPEAGSWKLEAGSWKPEAGSRKLGAFFFGAPGAVAIYMTAGTPGEPRKNLSGRTPHNGGESNQCSANENHCRFVTQSGNGHMHRGRRND